VVGREAEGRIFFSKALQCSGHFIASAFVFGSMAME